MRTLLLLPLLLISCAGSAKMNADGSVVVQGPVMARSDRMAVNAKTAVGEIRVMIVNGNAEAVPNNALNVIGAGVGLHYGSVVNSSNNLNKTAQEANGRLPTVTPAQAVAPGTTVFPLVTQPAAAIIPKH